MTLVQVMRYHRNGIEYDAARHGMKIKGRGGAGPTPRGTYKGMTPSQLTAEKARIAEMRRQMGITDEPVKAKG